MKKISRLILGLLVLVLLIGLLGSGFVYYTLRQQFPQVTGEIKMAGLQGKVEIIRDKFGVPHIYADTPQDLFRAQGFVHAQDRYFQMEFWRRIGQGRLAELFGSSAATQDKFIRTVGWHLVARQEVALLDADSKSVLQAYADGVNDYALNNADKLGMEFKVLALNGVRFAPETWLPEHSLTWIKIMAWDLAGNLDAEIARMYLMEKGGDALAQALLPPYPKDAPVIVPTNKSEGSVRPISSPSHLPISSTLSLISNLKTLRAAIGEIDDEGIGSNNWVLAGARTSTGAPILANDPHLSVQMPSIWHQVGLHCRVLNNACPYNVVGVQFPGVPGVTIGHNGRIAWGVTNMEPDTQDLFIEKPNPDNPNEFEYNGKFEPAQIREEVIRVAGKESITLTVRTTRHGPILNEVFEDLKEAKQRLAYRWTALTPRTMFAALPKIDRAQNFEQFREALRDWHYASQNFVYADVDGNIGYQSTGIVPVRKKGNGSVPVPGWTDEYEWVGEIAFEQMPFVYNPPEGYIATANNSVLDEKSPLFFTADPERGYRARRIIQLIESKPKWGVADMSQIHGDVHSVHADDVLPFLAVLQSPDADTQTALKLLNAWDKNSNTDSVGATVFEAFWFKLLNEIFADDVGEDFAKNFFGTGTPEKLAVKNALANPALVFWDDMRTPAKETRDEIVLRALKNTMADLTVRLGKDTAQWQWGKVHQITFQNQTLGKSGVAPIEALFNRGPFPIIGASSSVNAQNHRTDFSVRSHPSWRMVVDLNDFTQSVGIHPTGQSGHTTHPHYDDMMPLWMVTQYQPLFWLREDVQKNAEATLVLSP